MSTNNNMLDKMLNTVMQSDIAVADKLTLIESLTDSNKNEELARDYEQATAPKETFKVTLTPSKGEMVYGHKRWSTEDREELFTIVKDTFGPYSEWDGLVTPSMSGDYKEALEQLGNHFNRTPLAIKSQLRDVVQPCTNEKNEKSIRISKEIAFEVGLIGDDELHA
jgi:hypothetical protein